MKILISMTDYVLNLSTEYPKGKSLHNTDWSKEFEQFSKLVISYAEFLKQSLKLEMFFPCDEDGNVLEEPKKTEYQVDVNTKCSGWKYLYDSNDKLIGYYDDRKWKENFVKFKQAKEKVLFENIPISQAKWLVNSFSTIESLSDISNTITPIYLNNNAIKQIGL